MHGRFSINRGTCPGCPPKVYAYAYFVSLLLLLLLCFLLFLVFILLLFSSSFSFSFFDNPLLFPLFLFLLLILLPPPHFTVPSHFASNIFSSHSSSFLPPPCSPPRPTDPVSFNCALFRLQLLRSTDS